MYPLQYHLSPSLFSATISHLNLQNCTYHKVLLSAANKSVLIRVSNEIYSPLNKLSNGCLGLQHEWILVEYEQIIISSLFGWLFASYSSTRPTSTTKITINHDVENLRRIEFIHESWHGTSLYHPLTGQRAAGQFPNIP